MARLALTLLAAAWALLASVAVAHELSGYETESLAIALEEVEGELDPAPEGKRIESVEIVTLDVFDPTTSPLSAMNVAHVTTQELVIRRELLLRVGEPWQSRRAEETERNLRVRQLSVVLVVALRGGSPQSVRLLAVTKDTWSLRVNWDILTVNGRIQGLYLKPSEENLLGLHKTVYGNLAIGRAAYSVGAGVFDGRVGGSRLRAAGEANAVINCASGRLEGMNGLFSYGKPLYSTRTAWSWITAGEFVQGIERPAGTVGQSICRGGSALPVDLAATRRVEAIPYQYRRDQLGAQLSATRSFGWPVKHDVSFGLEATRRAFSLPEMRGEPPSTRRGFAELIPVSDTRLSPFVQYHGYENRFLRALDVETLGLQEDHRLGHEVWLRAYPASRAVGSSRDLVGTYVGLGYAVPVFDGFLRGYAASRAELAGTAGTDAELLVGGRLVTPKLPFGRFVVDGFSLDRYRNYLNPLQSLGGTTRLRGYRAAAFVGPSALVTNVELRTPPVQVFSILAGLAAFYDAGDAFRRREEMVLRQGVGLGLRILLPQIERVVFRVDLATPLDRADPAGETTVVAQFRQAFPDPGPVPPALAP